jgi:hypothetical protein
MITFEIDGVRGTLEDGEVWSFPDSEVLDRIRIEARRRGADCYARDMLLSLAVNVIEGPVFDGTIVDVGDAAAREEPPPDPSKRETF